MKTNIKITIKLSVPLADINDITQKLEGVLRADAEIGLFGFKVKEARDKKVEEKTNKRERKLAKQTKKKNKRDERIAARLGHQVKV